MGIHGTHVVSRAFPCSHARKKISKSRWVTCLIQTARLRGMFHRCQHLISPRKKALNVFTTCTKLSGILEQLCLSLALQRHRSTTCTANLSSRSSGFMWCMCCQFPGISGIIQFPFSSLFIAAKSLIRTVHRVEVRKRLKAPVSRYEPSPEGSCWMSAKKWHTWDYLGLSVQKTGHVPENDRKVQFWGTEINRKILEVVVP